MPDLRLQQLAHLPWNRNDGTLARKGLTMDYTIRALDASMWEAFAKLVEFNNGIFGGCWCMGFHA